MERADILVVIVRSSEAEEAVEDTEEIARYSCDGRKHLQKRNVLLFI